MANCSDRPDQYPRVALLSSSSVGHLAPCLRLAALLVHHNCQVTLITNHPILSLAESKLISCFLQAFPQVVEKQFHVLPLDDTSTFKFDDPFWIRFEAARRSAHLLPPLLSSLSLPPSALVYDVTLISCVIPIIDKLNFPTYIVYPSGARMFSLFAYYHIALAKNGSNYFESIDGIDIPGVQPMPKSLIPPLLLNPSGIFPSIFKEDAKYLTKVNGSIMGTFEWLESESLTALNGGKVIDGLSPVFAIELPPSEFEKSLWSGPPKWLEDQSDKSVVFACFGSKIAMMREQTREIGKGLIWSGHPFMWVVKDKQVDKDEKDSLEEILGKDLMEEVKKQGLVVKEWLPQAEILGHRAVGGFVSHSGWNSLAECAWHGVPVLAWPQGGDGRVNAEVMEKAGFLMWERSWGWQGERLVKGEEIGEKIKEMMGSDFMRLKAVKVKEEARKALGTGGSCEIALKELIDEWKNGGRDI